MPPGISAASAAARLTVSGPCFPATSLPVAYTRLSSMLSGSTSRTQKLRPGRRSAAQRTNRWMSSSSLISIRSSRPRRKTAARICSGEGAAMARAVRGRDGRSRAGRSRAAARVPRVARWDTLLLLRLFGFPLGLRLGRHRRDAILARRASEVQDLRAPHVGLGLVAGDLADLADDFRHPLGLAHDDLGRAVVRAVAVELALEHLGIAHDARERLV